MYVWGGGWESSSPRKMAYISKTSTIITLFSVLSTAKLQSYTYDYGYNPNTKQYTRKIDIKQGSLQGIVVYLGSNTGLPPVEQYLGIPYATPPVGNMRFMPTGSAPSWRGIKYADTFGHVCPQNLPNSTSMETTRKIYFKRLKKYLMDESEDCLYLNIYAPFQEKGKIQKYPVMVFIHGESFEWNSGNPYDGSVLAAYGQVIVVTLNFRLGILGFLKTGIANDSRANFGLIDQIAALVWIKENIAKFGGDETKVTLFGHGTGAACVGHLMSSPMIEKGNTPLFQRAILMSGSSLSDWALATKSLEVTLQVGNSLNCPIEKEEFTACLRKKRLQDIMQASVDGSPYSTKFGPVVDNLIIPNEPIRLLTKYNGVVKNLELMYGVTEIESAHHLGDVALTHGMLEKERNVELGNYLKMRCEFDPDSCLARTLENYGKYYRSHEEPIIMLYKDHESDTPAKIARDMLLDVLSDACYTAPIVMTARLHSALNPQSYFYVFGHSTTSKDYVLNKSVHGEELPYVFGVPLDGPKFHFQDHYSSKEKLLSELVMSLWCNFAYSGNPSVSGTRLFSKLSQAPYFDITWPEFDEQNQRYLYLSKTPEVRQYYRQDEMKYWNEFFPHLSNNRSLGERFKLRIERPKKDFAPPNYSGKPKHFGQPDYSDFPIPPRATGRPTFGTQLLIPKNRPRFKDETPEGENFKAVLPQKPAPEQSNLMSILISIGALFLLANVIIFAGLYFKFVKMRKRNSVIKSYEEPAEGTSEKQPKVDDQTPGSGCNLITKLITSKSTKSEDTYEAVKTNESCSSKRKLTRQVSSSTIDAHTKVRDWIAQEIVHRYSPKFLRRARHQNSTESKKHKEDVKEAKPLQIRTNSKVSGSNSTLGQSPTRPVSPVEDFKEPVKPSLIPVQKLHKKAEKISVAVDATPAGRGSSVLMQEPIELTKSLDYGSFDSENDIPLRRSVTLEDFTAINSNFKNSANINLKFQPITEPTIIKIEHNHSKSDPADISSSSTTKKLKTFEPQDINVTSRDEMEDAKPLTPEESLQTIKRRNFPKVLPDLPGDSKQALANKRRSMPAPSHLFLPIPENSSISQPNSPTGGKCYLKQPPAPPPRISSSLGKNSSTPNVQSPVLLAQEPPVPEEPEVACNNLYIGPLIPSRENRKVILKPADSYKYNNQPIYDNLNPKPVAKLDHAGPKTVITSDPNSPVRRMEPKVIIKPKISRTISDPAKNKGPRVVVNDHMLNQGEQKTEADVARSNPVEVDHLAVPKFSRQNLKQKSSQIPTIVKGSNTSVNKESSSDSTPSESSDTGTVVKRV